MYDEKMKMEEAPTLTFEPFAEPAPQPELVLDVVEETAVVEQETTPALDESMLTETERQQVADFASKIELSNSTQILQYGVGAQKKMADFSETALNNVRTKDLGEVGDMLSGVVTELKSVDEEEDKGFFGLFKKGGNKLASMKAKYAKAETNVNEICEVLEGHQHQLLKDAAMLDQMYEMNLNYYKELSMYILAGRQKVNEVRNKELPALLERANMTGLAEDTQKARDMAEMCNRFEKKLHDLDLTRNVAMQMAPQIRLIQNNDTVMSEKIQSTLVNTIPLWKSQMVLAIGVDHSTQAAKAQREVTDMTNELLKKNAEALKLATIETARESERGIVDIETLQQTNQTLIATLDEVMAIQQEGRTRRSEAEVQLRQIEDEMRQKLLEMSGR